MLFSKNTTWKFANYVQCNLTRWYETQCSFREGVYHDSSWFSRNRSFAPPRRYTSWQGLKITTQQIWLHNSLRLPWPVNEFRTISTSIEQPENVFNILHTGQSEVILEFPRKNSSIHSKSCRSLLRNVKHLKYNNYLLCGWGNFRAWECYKISMSRSPCWSTSKWKEPLINKRPTSDRRCSDWQRTLSDD